jgi:integrase
MKRISKKSSGNGRSGAIYLKAPTLGSGRARFAIIEKKPNGTCQTVQSEALTAINVAFVEKKISFDQARIFVKDIVDQLRPKTAILHNQGNLKILEDYWSAEYADRDLIDLFSAKRRLIRAVEACGHYSLRSASQVELQTEINSKFKGNKQRNLVAALNQILKWLKRDIKLRKVREEIREVPHLSAEELESVLLLIQKPELKLLYETAFATGMRLGELFAMKPQDIIGSHVRVYYQIDRLLIRRQTKNRKDRNVYTLPKHREAVKSWAVLATKQELRGLEFSKITRKLTEKALGRSLTFHDLRHSYAIYLVSRGVGLTLVSQSLGDTIPVTEKYYSGFTLRPESIQLIDSILG